MGKRVETKLWLCLECWRIQPDNVDVCANCGASRPRGNIQ